MLGLTAGVMFAYYALLIRSYGVGDMSVVYPLARGLAPVLMTIAAFLAIGEALSTGQMVAVGLISLGIMVLSIGAGASRMVVGFALATGVSVATYSFFGGLAVRAAGTVLGFQACLEIITGLGMVGYALVTRRAQLPAYSDWPTFPQIFINGKLIGGCDIVHQMHESGELEPLLK